jgi:hypothetical protein
MSPVPHSLHTPFPLPLVSVAYGVGPPQKLDSIHVSIQFVALAASIFLKRIIVCKLGAFMTGPMSPVGKPTRFWKSPRRCHDGKDPDLCFAQLRSAS